MFEELGRIFRKSMTAFRAEVNRQEPEDQVAGLLASMRREWATAKAELPVLAEALERARSELGRERGLLEECERRGRLAEGIADTETVRIAGEFATRHRERILVLEQKVAAVEAEQALRLREVDEMKRRYMEADSNRFALLNEIRRAQSQGRMKSVAEDVGGSFSDWDRMAEKIDDSEAYVSALEELDMDSSAPPPPRSSPSDVEERLQEMKRRLGKE